jgi:hypothetical protein
VFKAIFPNYLCSSDIWSSYEGTWPIDTIHGGQLLQSKCCHFCIPFKYENVLLPSVHESWLRFILVSDLNLLTDIKISFVTLFFKSMGRRPLVSLWTDNESTKGPMICEYGEWQWNDIGMETRRTRRKTCASANLSIANSIWTEPGANPGLHGVKKSKLNTCLLTLRWIKELARKDDDRLS